MDGMDNSITSADDSSNQSFGSSAEVVAITQPAEQQQSSLVTGEALVAPSEQQPSIQDQPELQSEPDNNTSALQGESDTSLAPSGEPDTSLDELPAETDRSSSQIEAQEIEDQSKSTTAMAAPDDEPTAEVLEPLSLAAQDDEKEAATVPEDPAPPAELENVQQMLETLHLVEEDNIQESETSIHDEPEVKDEPPAEPETAETEPPTPTVPSETPEEAQESQDALPESQEAMEDKFLEKAEDLIERMEEEVVAASALPVLTACPIVPASSTIAGRDEQMLHHIKTVQFKDKKVGIVTQNENGPCPLVAILNVLLLRRQISLPANAEIATAGKLMEHIGDAMLDSVPKNLTGEERLNYERNMNDAMAVLPKLQTGLDVNVKFTGVRDFEYTPECIIFDLLRVPLFHGWLVDPQEKEVMAAIGQAGYNQLVEKVIGQKNSIDADKATEALIIEAFLERSASQLTYHGLSELSSSLADEEIGVLFRNNHFSTIYKHQNELFQLVTDQGFLGETNVVWETLSSIDGDGQFVDGQFRNVPPKPERAVMSPGSISAGGQGGSSANTSASSGSALHTSMTAEQQIDHDFLVALSLQEEQQQQQPVDSTAAIAEEDLPAVRPSESGVPMTEEDKSAQEQLDLALARQLQEEEERQAAEAEAVEREAAAAASGGGQVRSDQQQQQQSSSRSSQSGQSKNKNCNIL